MKRIIAILMAVMMCFSIVACSQSTEDMLQDALVLDWNTVHSKMLSNEARAKDAYHNKTVVWTATVYAIDEKYATMAVETSGGFPLNPISVYLTNDDLIKLNKGETYTIVGTLKLSSFTTIKNAHLVE